MRAVARILVVDDDPAFNAMLVERLTEQGDAVRSTTNISAALTLLDSERFDVAILDLKLDGQYGADVGIDSLGKVLDRAPAIKPIIITAYADAASVERAFHNGAYDYVEKTDFGVFYALLLAKIRNALEPAREARIASLTNGARETEIAKLWDDVQRETDRHKKGTRLEELLLIMWRSIPGFENTFPNQRSSNEEIDLVVENGSKDEIWRKESSYFLVECKNWTSKVEPKEVVWLREKLQTRQGRCKLGFFVAPYGFTAGVETALLKHSESGVMIVLLAKAELEQLVCAGGSEKRNQVLKELVRQAVVRGS
jgi:CheY-like chemotaxis protein